MTLILHRDPARAARLALQAAYRALGGPGSGNFGHAGRPGEVGGSASGAGRPDAASNLDLHPYARQSVEHVQKAGNYTLVLKNKHEGYGETRYEYTIEPKRPEGILSAATGFKNKDTTYYDPRLAEVVPSKTYEGTKDVQLKAGVKSELEPTEPGYLYRGMSYVEWLDIKREGRIQSAGDYNLGDKQVGETYFSTDIEQAAHYASGFAPWQYTPSFDRPAVVVKIKDPGTSRALNETERGLRGSIPLSDVVSVFEGQPYAIRPGEVEFYKDFSTRGKYSEGSRRSPSASIVWKKREDFKALGGPGSGNFGHAGRPGEVGGSSSVDVASALDQAESPEEIRQILDRAGAEPLHVAGKDIPNVFVTRDYVIEWDGVDRYPTITEKKEWVDQADVNAFYPNYEDKLNEEFWSGGGEVYHATTEDNVANIEKHGLNAGNLTRGISNRSEGPAVYTTTDIEETALGSYGDVVYAIDVGAMAKDHYTPYTSQEPDIVEGELRGALAYAVDLDNYEYDYEAGMSPSTVVIHGSIPAKYLKRIDQGSHKGAAARTLGGVGSGNFGHAGRPGDAELRDAEGDMAHQWHLTIHGVPASQALFDAVRHGTYNATTQALLYTAAKHPEGPLHVAADKYLDKFMVTLQYAFAKGRLGLGASRLDVDGAVQAMTEALQTTLPTTLAAIAVEGGRVALGHLEQPRAAAKPEKTFGSLKMRFDRRNQRVLDWADEHAAELIQGLTQTTRELLNEIITDALASGTIKTVEQDILDVVGDAARAELIARTEVMTAANAGQRLAWDDAVDEGLLTGHERVQWIATGDAGVCPICDELDGQTRKLDGEYPDPGGEGPPQHPRCRCTEGLV